MAYKKAFCPAAEQVKKEKPRKRTVWTNLEGWVGSNYWKGISYWEIIVYNRLFPLGEERCRKVKEFISTKKEGKTPG